MSQAATHRADLLRAWHRAGADATAQARWAGLMGFVPQLKADATPPERIDLPSTVAADVPAQAVAAPAEKRLQSRLPMLVHSEQLADEPTPDEPVPTLTPAECGPRRTDAEPPPAPLVPLPRLWPALRRSLSLPVVAGIDVARLKQALAQGQSLRQLPRRTRAQWVGPLHVVWDVAERMAPYQADFAALLADLVERRGAAGITLWQVEGGPLALRTAWVARGSAWRELPLDLGPAPARQDTVLLLSDMGTLTPHAGPAQHWLDWVQTCADTGARLISWAPHGLAWVDPAQARLVQVHCLQASSGLGAQRGLPDPAARCEARARQLAALRDQLLVVASFCYRLEPALLRKLRGLDPATAAEPGLEAALWAHRPVVRSGELSRPLAPEHLATWRARFATLPASLQAAALHAALQVHAWQGRSTEVADILAWDACASAKAKGPRERALVAEALAWLASLVDTEHRAPGRLSGVRAFAADLFDRQRGDGVLQQAHSAALSGLWVLSGGHDVPPGLASQDVLRQRRKIDQAASPAISHQLAWHATGLWFIAQGASALPPGAHRLGPVWHAAALHWRTEGPAASGVLALRGQAECLLYARQPLPAALTLTTASQRKRYELQARPAWAESWGCDACGLFADLQAGACVQRLRWIEPGSFLMGSPDTEFGRDRDEGPRHTVTLTQGHWLADTPCTQALWLAVMGGKNPSNFKDGPDAAECPVEQVSWDDVQGFLQRLQGLLPAGCAVALPTEAEWEYAARAGTNTAFWWGPDADATRMNVGGGPGRTTPVKRHPASPWGLHDVHGNVWEWCADSVRSYLDRPEVDVFGGTADDGRVLRGGSWNDPAVHARSAFRFPARREFRWLVRGFRFALRSPSLGGPAPALPGGRGPASGPAEPGRPPVATRRAPRSKK